MAVLSVIFFHADFPWATGGFTGVDVFFVISGFLITGILLRELRDGSFSLARFYERRARRILPALLVVLAVTLLACWLIMFASHLRVVGRTAVSVLAFAANFVFWRGADFGDLTTINYFGRRLHEQPLIHTWSLGVEEQFYLLFPITLLAVWRWARPLLLHTLIAGAVVSFALNVWMTPESPGVTFYLLPARGWELLAGGLIAWYGAAAIDQQVRVREIAALLGIALVLIPTFLYDSQTPFPGAYAAVPVIGTMLLLRYGPGSATGALLSWRPLVFVGLISYSAYLWHQPLFALARYIDLSGTLTPPVAIVLCGMTLLLAAITWQWVETPYRDRRRVSTRTLIWTCALSTFAVAIPASMFAFGGSGGRRSPIAAGIVGQSILSLFSDCNITLQVTRRLGLGCLLDPSSTARPSFLVVGDSHADALFPAFAKISRETGRQGRLLQHFSCMPLLEFSDVPTGTPGCIDMRRRAFEMVAAEDIKAVFLVSRFVFYTPHEHFAPRLEKTIAAYADLGATVFLVKQAPEQPLFDQRRYLRAVLLDTFLGIDAFPDVWWQSTTLEEHERIQAPATAVIESYRHDGRVRIVDFTPVLCDDHTCAAGTTALPYYVDDHHLNADGAILVSGTIAKALRH